MTRSNQSEQIYQIKVVLRNSRPQIWRRFQVPANTSLYKLHQILQVVMGWEDYHLYEFVIGETHYSEPSHEYGFELEDAKRAKLKGAVPEEKTKFTYIYDFGDNWKHDLLVEKILPPEPGVRYPVCLAGKNACPPEDCGGIWGYDDVLEAIQNPDDRKYDELREWVGKDFDPERFDLKEVNRQLQAIR